MNQKNMYPPGLDHKTEYSTIVGASQYWYSRAITAERKRAWFVCAAFIAGGALSWLVR